MKSQNRRSFGMVDVADLKESKLVLVMQFMRNSIVSNPILVGVASWLVGLVWLTVNGCENILYIYESHRRWCTHDAIIPP